MFDRIEAWCTRLSWDHSAATVTGYRYEIVRFQKSIGSLEVNADRLFEHLCTLPLSVRYRAANALKSFLRFVDRADLADAITLPLRDTGKPGRTLTPEQVLSVLMACDTSSPLGKRDVALQALLIDSGLRAAEVCRLEMSQVDLNARLLWVKVKGGQTGFGSFGLEVANCLSAWYSVRKSTMPYVFTALHHDRALTPDGLRTIFHRIGKVAGLPHYSPHDLRRTFATIASLLGAPPRVLQVAGRWENLGMVERYTASIRAKQIEAYLPISCIMRGAI